MVKDDFSVNGLDRFRKKYLFNFIIILLLSLTISLIIKNVLRLNLIWTIVTGSIFFLAFFMIMDVILTGNNEEMKFNLQLLISILTILIFLGQLFVSLNQANIISRQTVILDTTSQSIKPDVRVVSAQGYNSFLLSNINNEAFIHTISIGIVNLGKINSPFVAVATKYPGLFYGYSHYIDESGKLTEGTFSTENFPSLNYTTFWFYFNKAEDSSPIKPGITNLVFIVDCPFCQEPMKEQDIPICIYTNDTSKGIECGKEYL